MNESADHRLNNVRLEADTCDVVAVTVCHAAVLHGYVLRHRANLVERAVLVAG